MSDDIIAIALPATLGSIAADAVAPWGSLTAIAERETAVSLLGEHPPQLAVMVAAGLADLTTAEGIRTVKPDTVVCLLAPDGMTDRLAVHCMHRSRAQIILGPPLTVERIREQLRPFLPPPMGAAPSRPSVPEPAATASRDSTPRRPIDAQTSGAATPAPVSVEDDPEADLQEELLLARSIAEEAAGEVARLRAAAKRHQRAAEAAHQDLAQARASAAEARRRAEKAETERDTTAAERDNLSADLMILHEEAAAARAESGRLAQQLGALEAEQEQRAAESDWSVRAAEGMRARVEELEAQLETARADAERTHREHAEAESELRAEAAQAEGATRAQLAKAEGATRAALAEVAALRAAGPGRIAELEEQVSRLDQELSQLRHVGEQERADAHELRVALTRQQHQLTAAEAEASRLRDTVAAHDERAVVLVEGLRRAEAAAIQANEARDAAEADAAEARAQQLHDITWFMEQLRALRS